MICWTGRNQGNIVKKNRSNLPEVSGANGRRRPPVFPVLVAVMTPVMPENEGGRAGRRKGMAMCEAHAFILKDGKEEKVLENVDLVELEGDDVKLISIFGEQKTLRARLKRYNNTERKILFEAV